MFCENCGAKISNDKKFCENCGKLNSNYIENTINQVNKQSYQGVNPIVNTEKSYNKSNTNKIILLIIGVIILIIIVGNTFTNHYLNKNSYTEENTTTSILGQYSREIFSGNSFNYITPYDSAVFTFNKDSSFMVKYDDGNTYKGTYKVYNGLFITALTSEIANDTTINNNELLANDINKVANRMMTSDILNTYLLWLETDNNILQPFMILYDLEKNSGVAVNIYARVQGDFTKK